MTDEKTEIDLSALPVPSQETRTWAHKLMDAVREVQKLHVATMVSVTDDGEEEQVLVCQECSRVAEANGGETVEEWPCATAIAMGIEEGPLL